MSYFSLAELRSICSFCKLLNCLYTSKNPELLPEQTGTSKIEMENTKNYCRHTMLGDKKNPPQNILPSRSPKINPQDQFLQNSAMLKSKGLTEKLWFKKSRCLWSSRSTPLTRQARSKTIFPFPGAGQPACGGLVVSCPQESFSSGRDSSSGWLPWLPGARRSEL